MEGQIAFDGLHPFDMSVRYVEDAFGMPDRLEEHHIHEACEIYVYLSGDVSFMVEDRLYPIQYGDVVITRPYEYHHCIYHTKTRHRHFWILFSGTNNEKLLDLFFERRKGNGNLLTMESESMQELVEICFALCQKPQSEVEKYFYFFRLLRVLEQAELSGGGGVESKQEMASVLSAIHRRYGEKLSIRELAEQAHISISTMERWFDEHLHTTPSAYIQRVRLVNAAWLLTEGNSVTDTAARCGFSDVSAMIFQFKKQYGMTPLQYKKKMKKGESI